MSRKIDFFDGAESETVPVIGNVAASNLVQYDSDATYEATEAGAPIEGNLYYNTTDKVIRYYNGTEWISQVDTSTAQTLTNKAIDGSTNTISNVDGDNVIIDADGTLPLGTAQSTAKSHQDTLDDHETRVTTNEGNISTNTGNIATNTGNISTNTTNIGINTTNISTNTGDISTLQTDVTNLDNDKVEKDLTTADNTILRSEGTNTGAYQGSGITIDDSDNITGVNNITVSGDLTVNGTTTTINTGTLDVEDANVTVNKNGDQAVADAQGAGLTVEMSDATDATISYDSSLTSKFKIGESGSESEIADLDSTQTFSTSKTYSYDNTISGLTATDVKSAIDEVNSNIPTDTDGLSEGSTNLYYTEARVSANTDVLANTAKVSFPEAPNDGQQYVRQSEAWAVNTGGGGGGSAAKLIGGGNVNWNQTTGAVTFSADMYLEVASLDYTANTIPVSESGFILNADKQVAYVTPNDSNPGGNLTVSVGALTAAADDDIIIARRDGDDLLMGDTTRIVNGETKLLYQTGSNLTSGYKLIATQLLTSNATSNAVMTDLTLTGLIVGTDYVIGGQMVMETTGDDAVGVTVANGGTNIGQPLQNPDGPNNMVVAHGMNIAFTATDTTVTFTPFSASATSRVNGSNSRLGSYVTLMEDQSSAVSDNGRDFATKTLSTDITVNTSDIADLRFTGLKTNQWYEVTGAYLMDRTLAGVDSVFFQVRQNGTVILTAGITFDGSEIHGASISQKFKSTGTGNLTVDVSSINAGSRLRGDGTSGSTHVQLQEIYDLNETTKWD